MARQPGSVELYLPYARVGVRVTRYLQLQTGVEIIYMASITFPKIALVTLYLRIFLGRITRALAWIIIGVLVMFFISGLILALALCRPYAFKWNKTINGTCGDILAGYRWISIPSIITDVFILIIPIPTIWKLQLNKLKKTGIFITFLVGGLGVTTAIVRCTTFYQSDLFSDPTFLACSTMTWTVIEPSAYFICACLPRLRLVCKWLFEKTGLVHVITSTFGTMFSENVSSKGTLVQGGRNAKPANRGFGSNGSDDVVGFMQLDELQIDHHKSRSVHDHVLRSGSSGKV
ncbi:hypothetical protein P171DRAFT_422933 [Karstenula rhodostoma CBS 690.94]|uniref:Rhodopsin domain-containing protein n=1 Tax=Karstenula rhodostoma CBS 690.94 TaxID=1392251 RepID=A0A9P4P9G1_9PLEO|nr:hypothetical protein P171DRAFT_422933 [Karstenula rhodostoma CBS 690.94]